MNVCVREGSTHALKVVHVPIHLRHGLQWASDALPLALLAPQRLVLMLGARSACFQPPP